MTTNFIITHMHASIYLTRVQNYQTVVSYRHGYAKRLKMVQSPSNLDATVPLGQRN